jgi:murein DD-endopeptidase MepM/ murein hydrolase activator NlpD
MTPFQQLDGLVIKQLLMASGVFKGSGAAGSSLHADLFAEALADAVAGGNQVALAPTPQAAALPVPGRITSGFGARVDPITHAAADHRGVDLAGAEGTPIAAAGAGVVKSAGVRGGYGNAVEIDHGNGLTTLYAHASELKVQVGEQVTPGQTIATVGHTGRSTGDHLHFEMRVNGRQVDPLKGLKAYARRADEDLERTVRSR